MRSAKADTVRCSFCHKTEDVIERLIPSPSDLNVRICDECLAVCNSILSDVDYPPCPPADPDHPGHCRFCDPRTPILLNTIEQWVVVESQHRRSLVFLERACHLALSMMGLDSA
jgi:ATP-dependent protease Clp ATPase subunit